ncbi:hypothetical protein [Microvirga alba]|uniref:Uncharacterized protein n=1 Tax=Microvirga alba TaxID=2791025 RepID=A0A931BQZ3_9HYPH|nr:hypothetical protein [Microvirga alba]MBF9234054.1 hypothetical protein [Microvirga alba]
MRKNATAAALIILGSTALAPNAWALDPVNAPVKGKFDIKIVVDATAAGAMKADLTAFDMKNHHEVTASVELAFAYAEANDTVAEGYKDPTAAFDAKAKPLSEAAAKAAPVMSPNASMMKGMQQCVELKGDTEIQACMMKLASGLQGKLQQDCKTNPGACQAIDTLTDAKSQDALTAESAKFKKSMQDYRVYTAKSCTIDASIDYFRHERRNSEGGGASYLDRTSKTNGPVRPIASEGRLPCEVKAVVGPDNTVSFSFALFDGLSFPAKNTNPVAGDKPVRLQWDATLRFPYVVKKQTSFSGEQTLSPSPRLIKDGGWETKERSRATVAWTLKLD